MGQIHQINVEIHKEIILEPAHSYFKLSDIILFLSFPLAGYLFINETLPPPIFIFIFFIISFAVSFDNSIEGNNKLKYTLYFKIIRIILYILPIILSYNFSKKSSFCISLSVLISILYNNKKISSHKFPPLDSILHFSGAFSFTLAGGLWENNFSGKLLSVALAISFLFTGGYWNHLLIDKEKDFKKGKFTLAHKLGDKFLKIGAIFFISLGDLIFSFFFNWKFIFVFLATIFFGIFIKNYKKYRTIYRIIHLISSIFVFI